jgi:hypothetical protein
LNSSATHCSCIGVLGSRKNKETERNPEASKQIYRSQSHPEEKHTLPCAFFNTPYWHLYIKREGNMVEQEERGRVKWTGWAGLGRSGGGGGGGDGGVVTRLIPTYLPTYRHRMISTPSRRRDASNGDSQKRRDVKPLPLLLCRGFHFPSPPVPPLLACVTAASTSWLVLPSLVSFMAELS